MINRKINVLITILIFGIFAVSCKSGYIEEDSFFHRNLSGKIKSIKEVAFRLEVIHYDQPKKRIRLGDYLPEREDDEIFRNAIVTYNKNGTRNTFLKTAINDTIIERKSYIYDKKRTLKQIKHYKRLIKTSVSFQNGKKTEGYTFGPLKLSESSAYSYEKKNLVEIKNMLYRKKNNQNDLYLNWTKIYKYNKQGKLNKEIKLNGLNEKVSEVTVAFDANNNLVQKFEENVRYRTNKTNYTYNAQNKVIQKDYYVFDADLENDLAEKRYYHYDNNTIDYFIVIDFQEKTTTAHLVNSKGLVTTSYKTQGIIDQPIFEKFEQFETNTFEFVYDNEGNWIRRTKYVEGIPVRVTERVIEYW